MKKAGFNEKKNNDNVILIVIGVIVVAFIFGLKPVYRTMQKLQNGTLFQKTDTNKKDDNKKPSDEYKILEPIGASKLVCKTSVMSEGGDKTTKATLYYTNNNLKSIKEEISYSSITDEYTNYILSEQSKYKQRKTSNLKNKGYSIEINLLSTTTLDISSVYLLDKMDLKDITLSTNDILDIYGEFDQNIYDAATLYTNSGYVCEW